MDSFHGSVSWIRILYQRFVSWFRIMGMFGDSIHNYHGYCEGALPGYFFPYTSQIGIRVKGEGVNKHAIFVGLIVNRYVGR